MPADESGTHARRTLCISGLLTLNESDVRRLLTIEAMVPALEAAFVALSSGRAMIPARVAAVAPNGNLLAAMPGYVDGMMASKLVTIFPTNQALSVPVVQAVVVLFDVQTGSPLAVIEGNHLTAMRTAGSTAIAVRCLAPNHATCLTILGAGVQARAHMAVVPVVRPFSEVRLASRTRARALSLAEDFPGVVVFDAIEDAVRGADVICACTDSPAPIIEADWLNPGAVVASVGFSAGPELPAAIIRQAQLYVETRDAFKPFPAGAHELQGSDPRAACELGELLVDGGARVRSGHDIAVYKSTGHASEDVAAAHVVYEAAVQERSRTDA